MNSEYISVKHAKEHNLKNISVKIPRNQFVVITGLSGSGKSSLAFDTIYAEGQRRYVESLSAYARQFLDQMQKPDVESIDGLSPTISIEQKTTSRNPRSTVATQTEIYDYLRVLFARAGDPYYKGKKLTKQSSQEIIDQILQLEEGTKINILAPLVKGKKGTYPNIGEQVIKAGFTRLRVDGDIYDANDEIKLDRYKIHHIEIVVDRLSVKPSVRKRLADSVEVALKVGQGSMLISFYESQKDMMFSESFAVPGEQINLPEIEPRIFSFNSPYGACPECNGLGTKMEMDPEALVPDPEKTWVTAIAPWRKGRRSYMMYYRAVLRELAALYDIDPTIPYQDLPKSFKKVVLYGSNDEVWGKPFVGVIKYLENMFKGTDSDWLKDELSKFMSEQACPACNGARLKKESLMIQIEGKTINDITDMSIKEAKTFFASLKLEKEKKLIGEPVLKEINRRLNFCVDVGLDYLGLNRKSSTLSGGEAERIRLATQVGSGLVGVVYVLDEPSIGLHQRDNDRLLNTLHSLRDLGNTLIVVEHDEDTICQSDYVIDLGPGAGRHGGKVTYAGPAKDLKKAEKSVTAQYLRKEKTIFQPKERKPVDLKKSIRIKGAAENNLQKANVTIPLGVFSCVTGVSGSGKSTLVEEVLYKSLAKHFHGSRVKPGKHTSIKGFDLIDKVIVIDQTPIGRTPRSNPATYTGMFTHIRSLFSELPEAKLRGYKPGRFSFNVKGGRCESCQGDGIKKIEMHFLPDVYVTCELCKGRRFNEQTLEVTYKGKDIADVLDMSVNEALEVFDSVPSIKRILDTLYDVGLGYIKLGQPATTLSGGEAQRVKLSSELYKKSTGQTLYILDEPTTGLHFADIDKLLQVLHRLVDRGNSIVVIEHNLDVIKSSDYIIDLGPEGGDKGGMVVAAGTPEEVAKVKASYTGQYLKKVLRQKKA